MTDLDALNSLIAGDPKISSQRLDYLMQTLGRNKLFVDDEYNRIIQSLRYLRDNSGGGGTIDPQDYDLDQFLNASSNPFVREDELPTFIPDRVLPQTNITGSYALNWSLYEVWDLILTGNSTLTNSNLVNGKTIKILISGSFTLNLTAFNSVKGTYNGAIKNLIVASNINNYLSLTINPAD
jgi:hypothetical protein